MPTVPTHLCALSRHDVAGGVIRLLTHCRTYIRMRGTEDASFPERSAIAGCLLRDRGGSALKVDGRHDARAGHHAHLPTSRAARCSGRHISAGHAQPSGRQVDELVLPSRLHRRILRIEGCQSGHINRKRDGRPSREITERRRPSAALRVRAGGATDVTTIWLLPRAAKVPKSCASR